MFEALAVSRFTDVISGYQPRQSYASFDLG